MKGMLLRWWHSEHAEDRKTAGRNVLSYHLSNGMWAHVILGV